MTVSLEPYETNTIVCGHVLNVLREHNGQFKAGQHWREPRLYWEKEWLYREYVLRQRSAAEIAMDFDCKENNILYFLHKHGIETRSVGQARAVKHWGSEGEDNPMFGRTGNANPNWKGGITPERQALYTSQAWKCAVGTVWNRDLATCQRCGTKAPSEDKAGALFHVHHIIGFEVVEQRTEPDNLVLLCAPCHSWVHSGENMQGQFRKEVVNSGATGTVQGR